MPSIAASVLLCLACMGVAAEPTTPRAAVEALTISGAVTIAPDQIRDTLTGKPLIRRLARKGTSLEDLATTAAPLVELGYRTSGFAEASVSAIGPKLAIHEGPRRTWSDLVVSAPTPQAEALAVALLREPTVRGTGLPIPTDRGLKSSDTVEPYWKQGSAAHFEPNFGDGVRSHLERGWASSGRSKPTVMVTVEPVGADAAKCVVSVTEPAAVAISVIHIDGAQANPPADIRDWLDRHAGIRVGTPADPALLNIGCTKMEDTGRFLSVSAKVGDGGVVSVRVSEHPLLPLLNAELTDWQKRWLDMGEQMRVLYETGPGIILSAQNAQMRLSGSLRLSRSHGVGLRVGFVRSGPQAWELLLLKDRFGMTRSGRTPISCRLDQGGPHGIFGILPADDTKTTMRITAEIGFNTKRSSGMRWVCAPAALLATAGRVWTEDSVKPGTWINLDDEGKERFRVTWDAERIWRGWDFCNAIEGMRISPAEPEPVPAFGPDLTGVDFFREVSREPSIWLRTYADQSWADIPLGLAAGVLAPGAALWPVGTAEDGTRLEFSIPEIPEDSAQQPTAQMAHIGALLSIAADSLGDKIGPRAWPTLLCAGVGAALEGDIVGFSAIVQDLARSEKMGPLACLLEARLLHAANSPFAARVAALGLTRCSPERAWADITTCAGTEDLVLRWTQAIDRVDDAVRLAPPELRAGIAADLHSIKTATETERRTLLATSFNRWWKSGLGDLVKAELQRIASPDKETGKHTDMP